MSGLIKRDDRSCKL